MALEHSGLGAIAMKTKTVKWIRNKLMRRD